MPQPAPKPGDTLLIRNGIPVTVQRVYPAGTVDVVTKDGVWLRVTGLPFR